MIWFPFFPGDYMRDTANLTLVEHGAYRVMLDHYYATGGPLPGKIESLIRICRAFDENEQNAVKLVADVFFPVDGDGMRHNKRADKVIAEQTEKQKDNTAKAKRAASARWAPSNAQAMPQAIFDTEEFRQAWKDWQQHRLEIEKPLKPAMSKAQMAKFSEWGEARAIGAIRHTIAMGWQGLREPETTGLEVSESEIAERAKRAGRTAQCDGCRHCKDGWVTWLTPLENRESVPCTCAAGQWLLSNVYPFTKYSASQIEKLKRRSAQAVSNERSEE